MIGMGSAMDVLQGLGADYPDGVWASGRYYFGYPDSPENKRFNDAFKKALEHVSELPLRDRVHGAVRSEESGGEGALDRDREGNRGARRPRAGSPRRQVRHPQGGPPGRVRSAWGQIKHDPKFPMPTLANLKVFPTDEYYRKPPFAPVEG